jgi:hypothetical protein
MEGWRSSYLRLTNFRDTYLLLKPSETHTISIYTIHNLVEQPGLKHCQTHIHIYLQPEWQNQSESDLEL